MNSFFVTDAIYKERIAICKSCDKYIKLLGNCSICKCFMKVKARLAPMECADNPKKWIKTTEIEIPEELPNEIIEEVLEIWQDIKTTRAKDTQTKKKMIELFNTITGTNYNTNTNCSSCLSSCYDGIKKVYEKYKK